MENFEKATDDFRIIVVKVAKKLPRQKEKNKSWIEWTVNPQFTKRERIFI
jgi:hypothetical protein